jgi:hypothetical protein
MIRVVQDFQDVAGRLPLQTLRELVEDASLTRVVQVEDVPPQVRLVTERSQHPVGGVEEPLVPVVCASLLCGDNTGVAEMGVRKPDAAGAGHENFHRGAEHVMVFAEIPVDHFLIWPREHKLPLRRLQCLCEEGAIPLRRARSD